MSSDRLDAAAGGLAIRVDGVGKCFEIYDTPRDRLKQFILPRLRRSLGLQPRQYYRSFTALDNVSFEITKGETVGIIGRNGAGKSTLLQILCGTLAPTSGAVEVNGRVAALLELGAGFNVEFSGRENIYMNASVLGLSREEIDARLADIVAFADIGDFLEQPVKTYSSGMFVRLAFAVAVHVDADILIVDEALSVGDMYFQAKCMSQLKKLMQSGVTVLFVSHDVTAVKALCTRAIYLEKGRVAAVGTTDEVVERYYAAGVQKGQDVVTMRDEPAPGEAVQQGASWMEGCADFACRADFQRIRNGMAGFVNVQLRGADALVTQRTVDYGSRVTLEMTFRCYVPLASIGLAYHIRDKNGFDVVYSDTAVENLHVTNLEVDETVQVNWDFDLNLRAGDYTVAAMLSIPIDLSIGKVEVCDFVPIAAQFSVSRGERYPLYGAVHWENAVSISRCGPELPPIDQ